MLCQRGAQKRYILQPLKTERVENNKYSTFPKGSFSSPILYINNFMSNTKSVMPTAALHVKFHEVTELAL